MDSRATQAMLMFFGGAAGLIPAIGVAVVWLSLRGDQACSQLEPICDETAVFPVKAMLFMQMVLLPVTLTALVFLKNAVDLEKLSRVIHSEPELTKEET